MLLPRSCNAMTDRSSVPVSVVIPCYRCSATIARAVDSVVRQRARPAELILVDDASGDGTLSVLRDMERRYPGWVKVVALSRNSGAASARNAGWSAANREYVAFLDADDAWYPEKLRMQYDFMAVNPDVVLSGHQCDWLRDGESFPVASSACATTRVPALSLIFRSCFSTPTVMLRRDIPFRFPESRSYSEDLHLWQQIAFAGLPVVRMETALACFYKAPYGEGGLSASLWKMEKGELQNLADLHRAGKINWLLYVASVLFSVMKYMKRLLLVGLGRQGRG